MMLGFAHVHDSCLFSGDGRRGREGGSTQKILSVSDSGRHGSFQAPHTNVRELTREALAALEIMHAYAPARRWTGWRPSFHTSEGPRW